MSLVQHFEYHKPGTLDEALTILSDRDRRVRVLAGGTDLIPWMSEEQVSPEVLVDIKGLDQLSEIRLSDGGLMVGALATFTELIDSAAVRQEFPLLLEMAANVASPGIRNRATLGGNICSAVPSCDSGPTLLVYGAQIRIRESGGERNIPIEEWFTGPKQNALKAGEMVTGVFLPSAGEKHGGCYVKLGRYRGEDLAQASVAVLALPGHHYRVAFGAVAPTPVRAKKIEALLDGQELNGSIMGRAQELVSEEIAPITDIRATEQYRMHMVRVMLERGLWAAQSRLNGAGPPYGERFI